MGKPNKLLLPFNDVSLVQHTFNQICLSNFDQIIVVTGYQASLITKELSLVDIEFTHNKDYKTGMSSSIKCGIGKLHTNSTAFMVCLADMPFLSNKEYNLIIKKFDSCYIQKPLIITPFIGKKRVNPVLFSKHFMSQVMENKNKNGCSEIVKSNKQFIKKVELEKIQSSIDIDTESDYKNVIELLNFV